MNRFIKDFLLFILFTAILYVVLICLWGDHTPLIWQKNLRNRYGHMFTRIQEVNQYKDVDILFIGSSHAYRGFDPRIFKKYGFYTFNLGSSAQTPIQTELLLHRYLDKLNPKVIVFEVNPGGFVTDGIESSLDILATDRIDLLSIVMSLKQNNVKVYNTLIYGIYINLLNKGYFKEEGLWDIENDTYIKGGFVEKKLRYYKEQYIEQKELDIHVEQFKSFENSVSLIKSRNIDLFLIQAPVTQSQYRSYSKHWDFDAKINEFGVYLNFNEMIQLDDTLHFFDRHHLNKNGVELFNTKLIELLFVGKENKYLQQGASRKSKYDSLQRR